MENLNILQLEDDYDEYTTECECAMRTVLARLTNLQVEMERSSERSPFDTIDSRIKSFDSAIEKCRRRGLPLTIESLKSLHDVAGIRIITPFLDDIYTVAEALTHQPSMTVVEKKDYVKEPKSNGYRSLHFIVNMEIYFMRTSKSIPVEIQIRDKAMDLWATLEHIVKYKNPCPGPDVERQFKEIAGVLAQFDLSAIKLRDDSAEEEQLRQETKIPKSKDAIPMPGPTVDEPTSGLSKTEIDNLLQALSEGEEELM